jgi:hypothetical protein
VPFEPKTMPRAPVPAPAAPTGKGHCCCLRPPKPDPRSARPSRPSLSRPLRAQTAKIQHKSCSSGSLASAAGTPSAGTVSACWNTVLTAAKELAGLRRVSAENTVGLPGISDDQNSLFGAVPHA